MIRPLHQVRVYACLQPTDMRRGFDGLSRMVRDLLQQDPLSGSLFLFRNRSRARLKILYWDRDGLAIWYKRLERGSFQFPSDLQPKTAAAACVVSVEELTCLLDGIDLSSVHRRRRFALPEKLSGNEKSYETKPAKVKGRAYRQVGIQTTCQHPLKNFSNWCWHSRCRQYSRSRKHFVAPQLMRSVKPSSKSSTRLS